MSSVNTFLYLSLIALFPHVIHLSVNYIHSSCGELIYTMKTHKNMVLSMALSHNQFLTSGDKYGAILISDIISGGVLYKMKEEYGSISVLTMVEIKGYTYFLLLQQYGINLANMVWSCSLTNCHFTQ